MVALSEIEKRGPRLTPEQKAERKRQQTQARVGLASNVLGLSAGAAATGAALRDPRFGVKGQGRRPGAGKLANKIYAAGQKIPQPIARLTRNVGPKGAAALAGGALALQAGNVGGDVVANRVLARSAQQGQPVKKDDGERMLDAFISKSDHTTGHGSIEKARRSNEERRAMAMQAREDAIKSGKIRRGLFEKAYRRYDPEADRQRRIGLAAGAGLLGAGLAGQAAARRFTTDVHGKGGKPRLRGIAVKPGRGKGAALYSLAALGSGAAGVGAYRKGISERNNPWN